MLSKYRNQIRFNFSHLSPEAAVEGAVLDGLVEVFGEDIVGVVEVGDRACDLEYPVVGACAQLKLADRVAELRLTGPV